MTYRTLIVAALFAVLGQGVPAPSEAVEAARCGWDPSCLCITWFGETGARIEIRCPGGNNDGWTPPDGGSGGSSGGGEGGPGGGGAPPIVDPKGSWDGTGNFGGPGFLLGAPLDFDDEVYTLNAEELAKGMLRSDPECRALFQGSPLTENAVWLLGKIEWRDGAGLRECLKGKPAFIRNFGQHEPIAYLCKGFFESGELFSAQLLIHEALHVAGQTEDKSTSAGPGDPPSSVGIQTAVMLACDGE